MATLLGNILNKTAPKQIIFSDKYGAPHSANCNCVYCKSYGYRSPGHKYWRVRRAERLCNPQGQYFSGSILPGGVGTLPSILTISNRQRAGLIQQWTKKIKRTKSPLVKQRYIKYVGVIAHKKRPSWHQSEKDLQFLLNYPGEKNVEIKNYNIQMPDAFIRGLRNQIPPLTNPANSIRNKKIILDFRGQNTGMPQLRIFIKRIIRQTGMPAQNFTAVIWK
jgi:hypothetical protein